MSTFKKPPVYAETIFRILDASEERDDLAGLMSKMDWVFPGGNFREVDGVAVDGTLFPACDFEIPGGKLSDMADDTAARERAGSIGHDRIPETLRVVMMNRKRAYSLRQKSKEMITAMTNVALADDRTITSGMKSVYCMVDMIMDDALSNRIPTPVARVTQREAVMLEAIIGGSASSDVDITALAGNADVFLSVARANLVWELTAAVDLMTRVHNTISYGYTDIDVMDVEEEVSASPEDFDPTYAGRSVRSERMFGRGFQRWPGYVLWMQGRKTHIIGRSDVAKVIQLLTGIRNYIVALSAESSVGPVNDKVDAVNALLIFRRTVTRLVKIAATLPTGSHLDVAKAMKTMLAVMKAKMAGDLASSFVPDLIEDFEKTSVADALRGLYTDTLASVESLGPRMRLTVAKVFRLLPPPDVWPVSALQKRWEDARIHRLLPVNLEAEFKEALKEVILTARMKDKTYKLVLIDDNKRPSWWKHYLCREYDKIPTSELSRYVKFRGIVTLAERSRYDPTCWKDSGCGASTMKEAMKDRRRPVDKNFMMNMLFKNDCPMPDDPIAERYVSSCKQPNGDMVWDDEQEMSNTDLKPESHKERIFYSNMIRSRLHQSRCEATVGPTMGYHSAFAIQKTGPERDETFDAMSYPPPSTIDEPMMREFTGDFWVVLFNSFDIKGWSRTMADNIQTWSQETWDEATDSKAFTSTRANRFRSIVHMNSGGAKAWYTNAGTNFEGYNGKEMTALHIAIMTIAVRRLRAALPEVPAAMLRIILQAYIDDGVARLVVPSSIAKRVHSVWTTVITSTWDEFGFEIELKKSFPSTYYFEFLGEEYLGGRHLATGTKAAMRITADPFEDHENLVERVAKLSSACRGAATAGLIPISAYFMQSFFVANEVRNWIPIKNPTAVAYWLLTPRGLGGCGMPGLFQQSTNASGAAMEEGMCSLHAWGCHNSSVKAAYVATVRRKLRVRDAGSVLRSPLGGETVWGCMPASEIAKAVTEALEHKKGRLSRLALSMCALNDLDKTDEVAASVISLMRGQVIQEVVLDDLASALPSAIYRSFIARFEKAKTLEVLASRRKLKSISARSRRQARESYNIISQVVGSTRKTREGFRSRLW